MKRPRFIFKKLVFDVVHTSMMGGNRVNCDDAGFETWADDPTRERVEIPVS